MGAAGAQDFTCLLCDAIGLTADIMKSLDPRVNRLPAVGTPGNLPPKEQLDQLGNFEVFVQPRTGKPFQHEGAVHAPDLEMAFVLAKETFTRRFTCHSLCVCDTREVVVSPVSENNGNVFSLLPAGSSGSMESFEVYHLPKRGKQMVHAGTFQAMNPYEAMKQSEAVTAGKIIYGVWAIPTRAFLFTAADEEDSWITLPEKKFRDASDYKGGDRLKNFIEATQKIQP